jgi:hypothetical protein
LTSTRDVGLDVAMVVESLVDLDIDPASRCKVEDGVKLYVAVEDNVEGSDLEVKVEVNLGVASELATDRHPRRPHRPRHLVPSLATLTRRDTP